MSRLWVSLCTLVPFVVVLGCSPGNVPTPVPPSTSVPASAPSPAVKMGGILRTWMGGEAGGFDPQRKVQLSPHFTAPVFNNLIRFDTSKQALDPASLQPDLAERWEISPDGRTYTFYLQRGVKWHDGKPFTADDVVGNFQKMKDPKRSSMSSNFPTFDKVVKLDDYAVKVTLSAPQPSFLPQLASAYAAMVPLQQGDNFKLTSFLVGTGPFKFQEYKAGMEYTYVRNPEYFKKDAQGNRLPYLDGLSISIIPDRNAQMSATITKRVDLTRPGYGVTSQEIFDRYKTQAPDVMYQFWNGDAEIFHFNQKFKPLADIRVRKAMIWATDMEAAVMGAYGSQQFRGQDGTIMPRAYTIGKEEKWKLLGWDKPYDQRVAQAKQLMADAGYAAGGFKIRILTINIPELVRLTEVLADQWKRAINVDSQIEAFVSADVNDRRDRGAYELYMSGVNTMAGDPDEIMGGFITGGSDNRSFYSNPDVDRMAKEQSLATDLKQRIAICKEIERRIILDAVVIPQGWLSYGSVYWPYVKGYVQQDVAYGAHLQMERVWLDK